MKLLPRARRTRIVLLVTAGIVLVLVAVGVAGLLAGPPAPPIGPATTATPGASSRPERPAAVAPSSDAETFARRVSSVLFDWDTTATGSPAAIVEAVMSTTVLGGEDVPGLYSDVAGYLPTAGQWAQLRQYGTTQRLEIERATVPDSWAGIRDDPDNALPAGTVAITVEGTRVREGSWGGRAATTRSPVAFTLFLTCPPAVADTCRLLRLSALDTPLR